MDAATTGNDLRNLERLCPDVRDRVREYAARVREAFAATECALAVYGSALTRDFDASRDVVRSAVVLGVVDLGTLRHLAQRGARLGQGGVAAPLLLTWAEIDASRDAYPLELLEIQQLHVTIMGRDSFEGLTFDAAHVRLQCERELRRVRIGLRQGLLSAAGRERVVPELLHDAVEPVIRTLRGLLWLRGKRDSLSPPLMVQEVAKLAGREVAGLREALARHRRLGWAEFDRFYDEVVFLGEMVNAW